MVVLEAMPSNNYAEMMFLSRCKLPMQQRNLNNCEVFFMKINEILQKLSHVISFMKKWKGHFLCENSQGILDSTEHAKKCRHAGQPGHESSVRTRGTFPSRSYWNSFLFLFLRGFLVVLIIYMGPVWILLVSRMRVPRKKNLTCMVY